MIRARARGERCTEKFSFPDGSKTAEHALPYARCFAGNWRIPIELLSVVDVVEMTRELPAAESLFLDRFIEDETRRLENYLEQIGKKFTDEFVRFRVEKGRAAEVIIDAAAADQETLIAMATHGHSGLGRWLIGSVAEKVLRAACNPLLLVRAAESDSQLEVAAFQSIIVPLDGSAVAERVLPRVEEIAKTLDLEVVLSRVVGIPYYPAEEGFYDPTMMEALVASLEAEGLEYLQAKAEDLRKRGVEKISVVVKQGRAADEIISLARERPDSLIAMCTHGRSGVKRWLLGSVTETVARHAPDPVLIVRASGA